MKKANPYLLALVIALVLGAIGFTVFEFITKPEKRGDIVLRAVLKIGLPLVAGTLYLVGKWLIGGGKKSDVLVKKGNAPITPE